MSKEESSFKIAVVTHVNRPDCELVLTVERIPNIEMAKALADYLAEWLTENGDCGWSTRVQ